MLAADEPGQIAVALCIRAIQADLVYTQVGMCAVREADRARSTGDLFHGNGVSQVAEPRAAPALRDGDAQQALLAEGGPQVARKFVVAVDVGRTRRNPLGGETAHLRADFLEALIEPEITIYGSHTL